jgi:hypothetical protein
MPTLEQPSDLKMKLQASVDATRVVWTVHDFVTALLAQCSPSELVDSIEFGIGPDGRRRLTVGRGDHGIEVRER